MRYTSSKNIQQSIRQLSVTLLCLIIFTPFANLYAQQLSPAIPQLLTREINLAKQDSNSMKLQFELGQYYLDIKGSFKPYLDSAQLHFQKALNLNNIFKYVKLRNEILMSQGDCYVQSKSFDKARQCFTEVTDYYKRTGDKYNEAKTWDRYGECFDRAASLIDIKINCYNQAVGIYNSIPDKLAAITEFKKVADMHMVQGKYKQSENELLDVVARYKAIHFNKLHYTYDLLASVNDAKGDLHMALFYRLQVIKSMEASGDSAYARYFYDNLANTYNDVGMLDKSLATYMIVLKLAKAQKHFDSFYDVLRKSVRIYVALGKTQQALNFLKKQSSETPPVNFKQMEFLNAGYGICYENLGEENKAEQCYLEMVRYAHLYNQSDDLSEYMQSYMIISRFYIKKKLFNKSKPYLNELLKLPRFLIKPVMLNEVELDQFKADSAAHQYLAAIDHYQVYKYLNDSLFNANQKKLIEVVQLKNESDEKDIALQLQSKNIQLLKKQEQLEHIQIERSHIIRDILIGGSGMLLLLMVLGYNRYRIKQDSNLQLQKNQKVISDKNEELEQSLLENEWLLREVHHRVKNNMQMVSSLLVSQCEFLKDEAAINAIMESRHRIQAMSLIHQKLYKTNNVSTIYMPEYVGELVDYLKASFKIRKSIYFELKIEPIHLDVQQALPVGLILNEVITNAINHAFPFTEDDKITISLRLINQEDLMLTVADNGKGLSDGFNIDLHKESFGLLLVKGMIEDIGGTFSLDGKNGTIININFSINPET